MGIIYLQPKFDTLGSAIVRGKSIPRQIKEDTVTYSANFIPIDSNRSIIDLLKQVPGFTIDQIGNIFYNGVKVDQIRINGDEVFSMSPGLLLKNLKSDLISKIEFIDAKDDYSAFSGIDNGKRKKIINLIMKESPNSSEFAKIDVGTNWQHINVGSAIAGIIKDRKQFEIAANNGNTGLAVASENIEGFGPTVDFSGGPVDALSASAGPGVPTMIGGAIHFSETSKDSTNHLILNYQTGHLASNPYSLNTIGEFINDTQYIQKQSNTSHDTQNGGLASFELLHKSDSMRTLILSGNLADYINQHNLSSKTASYINETLANSDARTLRSADQKKQLFTQIMYRTTLAHCNSQSLSAFFNINNQDWQTKGVLMDIITYPNLGNQVNSSDSISQNEQISNYDMAITSGISYTNHANKAANFGLSYNFYLDKYSKNQSTYNQSDENLLTKIDSLSGDFDSKLIIQRLSPTIWGNLQMLNYSFGVDMMQWANTENGQSGPLENMYRGIYPHFDLNHIFRPSCKVSLSYAQFSQPPSPTQLQPIYNNNDPLHLAHGNSNLKPSNSNNLSVSYSAISQLSIAIKYDLTCTNNYITTSTVTDSTGRQTTTLLNRDGAVFSNFNVSINRQIEKYKINANFDGDLSYDHSPSVLNSTLSYNLNSIYRGRFTLRKFKLNKYNMSVTIGASFTNNSNSLDKTLLNRYFTQMHSAELNILSIRNTNIGSALLYTRQGRSAVTGNGSSMTYLNSFVSRTLGSKKWTARIQFNNIFNSKTGTSRTSIDNINTESSTSTIGRYFLFCVSYKFGTAN